MALLPTITWGGQEFYDISGIVARDADMGGTRTATDGVAIHHSVGQTEFPDRNANGTSLDEQIEHIKAINRYHIEQQYGGFGYNAMCFRDGTVMTVGRAAGVRAHVAHENWHLTGICMAGDFSTREVPPGMYLGVARFLTAVEKDYGASEVRGHRNWVKPENMARWATSCPGDTGASFIGKMLLAKAAIIRGEQVALALEVQRKMAEVLVPTARDANLELLAAQVRFLSRGRFC